MLLLLAAPGRSAQVVETEVRLSPDLIPTFQAVRLRLDANKRNYSGSTRTELDVRHATAIVQFHAEGQRLTRLTLRQGADTIAVERASGDHGLVTLTAARSLKLGRAVLEIEFTHQYGTRAVGLYRAVQNNQGYLFTQFESDDAREAFPCWDEPGFKFPYQITLEIPAQHEALSNTPIERQSVKDGWKTLVFKRTPPLPSYLLAIACGPLEFTPIPGMRVPTRVVTVQGQKHLAGAALQSTPKLLAALEKWFGTPYPFEKLDLVAVPEFAYGAMENPGAITFRDDILLLDPATATVGQRRSHASVQAHEMAHMWFGDLVTMQWWDDLWLNESFADWMAAKITDQVYPEYKKGLNELQSIAGVKNSDAQPSTRAIREKTTAGNAGLTNVGLVYSKGNAVLSMFERFIGPEVFRKGVQAYLKEHAWGNASAGDLWKALDQASGGKVSASMATFTDQSGVPYIRVVPAPGGVRLTQSRFSFQGVTQTPQQWRIPVVLRYSDGRTTRTQRVLLTQESQLVPLPGADHLAWVMPNGEGRGYYAWSLPDEMLVRLAERSQESMDPFERVAFLGNLGMLMNAGEVHGDAYLKALAHFGSDPEPQVVSSTMTALQGVRLALITDDQSALFAEYVRRTLSPALARVGYERMAGEDEAISTMRGELLQWLARRGRDAQVMTFAKQAAKHYLADSTSVDPSIVDAVLNLTASQGDEPMFEEMRMRYEHATVPALRRRFLGTLGAFEDPALEARALQYMLSDTVRPTETFIVIMGFMGKDEAASRRLWEWMTANYDALAGKVPPPALRFMPMMGSGCDAARLAATQAFFSDPKHAVPGVESALERVSDNTRTCITLRQREGGAVRSYLQSLGTK
ncbi:MAG: M1 family aminopeptidase [Candidatus Eisenbacteria bacterium]